MDLRRVLIASPKALAAWEATRYPDAAPPTSAEFAYLKEALDQTFFIDGDRMDILKMVVYEVMDEWVAADGDPATRELRKADFRIR
jgi:hypothetical protein